MSSVEVIDFRCLSGYRDLAKALGCRKQLLKGVVTSKNRSSFYTEHRLPKSKGGHRLVYEPGPELKTAQRTFVERFDAFARQHIVGYPGKSVHGFVHKRGICSNARVHVGAQMLLRADIRSFFASISRKMVEESLRGHELTQKCARIVARFVTMNGALVEGAPTSPLIANLVCLPLDGELEALASATDTNYTRYADDLTFSGDRLPDRESIEAVLSTHGFKLSEKKFRVTKRGQAQYVTGMSVSSPPEPRAPRPLKRRLRQELYYANKYGIKSHSQRSGYASKQHAVNVIDGLVSHLQVCESNLGARTRARWRALLVQQRMEPTHPGATLVPSQALHLYVDETYLDDSNEVLCLCVVQTDDVDSLRSAARKVLSEHLGDPFPSGRRPELIKRGLHFCENTQDLRRDYIEKLSQESMRCFIAFKNTRGDPKKAYRELLSLLVSARLAKNRTAQLALSLETSSLINATLLEDLVRRLVEQLRSKDRGPTGFPAIAIRKKGDDVALSSADYVLGVFRAYARHDREHIDERRFEALRTKIRLIHDVDRDERFFRKSLFQGPLVL